MSAVALLSVLMCRPLNAALSLLLEGAVVRAGTHVRRAVLDAGTDVSTDVGGGDDVALVGRPSED